jgi:hypothetical protein
MRKSPQPRGKTNGRSREVAALLTAAHAVLENRALTDAASAILVACKAILGADAGLVAVSSPGGRDIEVACLDPGSVGLNSAAGLPEPLRRLCARASKVGRVVVANDLAKRAPQASPDDDHAALESVLVAPVTIASDVAGLVGLINGLMTYYTYFKDYRGDLLAGKRTLVVRSGLEKSRLLAVVSAFLPTLAFGLLRLSGMHRTPLNHTFILLGLLTVFLQLWTGVLYWRNPSGPRSYASLKTNFRACTCGQAALVGIFNPDLALWLFIFSYVFVGFLFDLHRNPKQ